MILAQLISQMVFNMWYWTRKAHREMELGLGDTVRFGWDELKKIVKEFFGKRKAGNA